MFEVNFFEKKQKNLLPYLLSGISFLLFLSVGLYFLFSFSYYQRVEAANTTWLQEQQKNTLVSRQMDRYAQLTKDLVDNQTVLQESQYPMNRVSEELIALIPDERETIMHFEITQDNYASFVLEKLTVQQIAEIMETIKLLPYVESVHMNRMENQGIDNHFLVEFGVSLDGSALQEEVEQ